MIRRPKILVINPNTSQSTTFDIEQSAQAAARLADIRAVYPTFGPASIEGYYDEAIAYAGVAEQAMFDSRLPSSPRCHHHRGFGDPGLEAAREVLHGPVLGIAEAASHMASIRVSSFSVITTLSRTCRMTEHLLQK